MSFQDLLDQVGGMGRFQIIQMIFLLLCNAMVAPHVMLENFTAVILGHRCWVHILDNATVSDNATGTLSQDTLLRISIPLDSNLRPEKCRRFIHPQWQLLHQNGTFSNMSEPDTEPCMDGWVYDRSSFLSTTVTEWDLVCESQSLNSVAKFFFMAGMLMGSIVCGYLTDRFGRRLLLTWSLFQLAVAETCAALAPTFLVYCSLRLLAGMSTTTILTNTVLLIVEWTTPKYQAMGATMVVLSGNLGQSMIGGLAYGIRNWHTLQLVVSIPIFFFLPSSSIRWVSESARWLIINNKPEEGLQKLKKAARLNGMETSADALTMEAVRSTMKEELQAAQKKPSLCDLFHSPNVIKWISLLSLVRFAIILPTFGLFLHLQHLATNVFLVQILLGAVGIPANYISIWTLNHKGRRISLFFFISMVGIYFLVIIFLPEEMQTMRIILTTLGGGLSSASISCSVTFSNELLPTVIRATGLGIIGVCTNLGAALAPLLMILQTYAAPIPWVIYGASCILAGLTVLLLPETRNQPLPDSLQDIKNEGKVSREVKQEDLSIKVTQF
ncbi:solute carrier family 22 member 9-like isoform X1 [Sciurus carolinensis]|uniref:solute carrier family 22 member 9-like isoform X1 n=1 Tax=Sciurus carolinensis TaxID=30640 RepID=UPI001FB4E8B1|nr:solute carrier family 22 member 9-like isoform X1 [Sciurus carolinensis]